MNQDPTTIRITSTTSAWQATIELESGPLVLSGSQGGSDAARICHDLGGAVAALSAIPEPSHVLLFGRPGLVSVARRALKNKPSARQRALRKEFAREASRHLSIRVVVSAISAPNTRAKKAARRLSPPSAGAWIVHTDGSAAPNPGEGGWGAIVQPPSGAELELAGYLAHSTNNRAELMGIIAALEFIPAGASVRVVTDSQYAVLCGNGALATGVKRKKPNADLWQRFLLAARNHATVELEWVRGHNGTALNERADALANRAREARGTIVPGALSAPPVGAP